MPPLAPHGDKSCSGGRHTRQENAVGGQRGPGRRSASFHERGWEPRHQLPKQRPKTQPDLLAGVRGAARSFRPAADEQVAAPRTPSKVLVSVSVQKSLWPLHIMASSGWTVAELLGAAVALYAKEDRRPLLPSTDPSVFGLHYSQFSLESLDPKEKVMELGSRSFFLCPKSSDTTETASSSSSSSSQEASRAMVMESAPRVVSQAPAWLVYMPFWPMM